jgi:signal peptidase I
MDQIEQTPKDKKEKNEVWEWIKALVIAFAVAALIRYFLFTPIVVDGDSMMPTLQDGDRMIVNKIDYKISDPDRFDIVVFHAPEGKDYIKRVIGVPGDYVEYKNDQLYVNGKKYDEPYLDASKAEVTDGHLTGDFSLNEIPGVNPDVTEVPEGYILVLGDNRRFSKDSRHIGLVEIDEVVGTTKFIFWPFKDIQFVD